MWAYILRRLGAGVVVLIVASFLMFMLVSLSGNPLAQLMANPHISKATIAAARAELHLNEPLLARYWTWLSGFVQGNFGMSTTGQPVGPQILPRFLVTLKLVVPAVILSVIIGVLVGVVGAIKQYTISDQVATGLAYLFYSTPVFVIALLLKNFLAVDFNNAIGRTVLYTVGDSTPGTSPGWPLLVNSAAHTVLPVLTLTLITYAGWSRYQRASMLDVLNADYIRLARAKGLSRRRVLYVHALRNALIPVTTVVAIDFATLLGGVIITEVVFGWEGMGRFLYEGLIGPVSPDVNIVQGWMMVVAILIVVFNIVADLIYALLDPRIRYA
ncbi:MAG: ABC transporter permease [Gemmatimonadota bacterium]